MAALGGAMNKMEPTARSVFKGQQRCVNCLYWQTVPLTYADAGHCHRFAPDSSGWPVTGKDEWCGEFQSKRPRMSEAVRDVLKLAFGLAVLTLMITLTFNSLLD
jgi:hypothetical protein